MRCLKLLELQRHAMLMYTSCGWFFDEISGIETVQVIQYAARAIQLARDECSVDLEPGFKERLALAPGNLPEMEHGGKVYDRHVKPSILELTRVGAHFAISSLFEEFEDWTRLYSYSAERKAFQVFETGAQRLAVGRAVIRSEVTWAEKDLTFGILHLGDQNLLGGIREFKGEEAFAAMLGQMEQAMERADITGVIRLLDEHFEDHQYSLWHLFKDQQRKVLLQVLGRRMEEIEDSLRRLADSNYPVMLAMRELSIPLPATMATPIGYILNQDLRAELEREEPDLERLKQLAERVTRLGLEPDRRLLGYVAGPLLNGIVMRLEGQAEDLPLLERVEQLFATLAPLRLELNLWRAQNAYFNLGLEQRPVMRRRTARGNREAGRWLELFDRLAGYLNVKGVEIAGAHVNV